MAEFYRSEDVSTDYAKLTTLIDIRNEATEQPVDVFVQLKDENGNVVVHHKGSIFYWRTVRNLLK